MNFFTYSHSAHRQVQLTDLLKKEFQPQKNGQNQTRRSPFQANRLEPWASRVDGAELLDKLAHEFRRFLVLPEHGDTILAVWNLHSYCFEKFDFSPILYISSPTKQCAKSRVLEVLAKLSFDTKSSSNMTGATMFRTIEACRPTLLLDEMDRSPKEKMEMITVELTSMLAH